MTIPLSTEQSVIWKRQHDSHNRCTPNIPVTVRLFGLLDKEALAAAVCDVVDRHEILRTIFPESNGVARQEILETAVAPELSIREIDTLNAAQVIKAAADHKFDLTRETPMRAHLFSTGKGQHTLLFVFHRIAFDSRSVDPLMRDLFAFYLARVEERKPNLSPMPMQYADYARMKSDNTSVTDTATDNEDEYFGDRGIVPIRINPGIHGKLIAFAKEADVSVDSVLHACWAFSSFNLDKSATVSTVEYGDFLPVNKESIPSECKPERRLPMMIGNFETVLSFELNTNDNPTFRDAVKRTSRAVTAGSANQPRPFRTLFRLKPSSVETFDFPMLKVFVNPVQAMESGFGLIFDLSERLSPDGNPQGIEGNVIFNSAIFDMHTMPKKLDGMMALLKQGLLNPDTRINELPIDDNPTSWECTALAAKSRATAPEFVPITRTVMVHSNGRNEKISLEITPAPSAIATAPGWQQSYVIYQDVLQCRLAGIWEEALNVSRVGVRDRFADLGGDADKARHVITTINNVFRKNFPVSLMCGGVTVESLASAIFRELPFEPVSEVQSRQPDSKPPLFFIHGDIFGGGFYTIELSQHLGNNRPFFSFNPHGLNGQDNVESIEKMAADNLKILRQIYPDGPFYIGGYCTGAFVAYEMARMMEREGQRLELPLLLLEAPTGDISGAQPQSVRESRKPSTEPTDSQARKAWVLNEMFRLSGSHKLGQYGGRVVVLQPEKSLSEEALVRSVWKTATSDMQFCNIPGDHITCIGRHAPELAGILKKYMDE